MPGARERPEFAGPPFPQSDVCPQSVPWAVLLSVRTMRIELMFNDDLSGAEEVLNMSSKFRADVKLIALQVISTRMSLAEGKSYRTHTTSTART